MRVALLGTTAMGAPMGRNLVAAGYGDEDVSAVVEAGR